MLWDMTVNSLIDKTSVEEYFPLQDIKENRLYFANGDILFLFKIDPLIFEDTFNPDIELYIKQIADILKNTDERTVLSFLVKGTKNHYKYKTEYEKFMKLDELKEQRVDYYFNSNKYPYMEYYLAIKYVNHKFVTPKEAKKGIIMPLEKFEKLVVGSLDKNNNFIEGLISNYQKNFNIADNLVTPLIGKELVNFIDFYFNPNERDRDKDYLNNYLNNASIPLLRVFARNPIHFENDFIKFGDTTCAKVFNLRYPPATQHIHGIFTLIDFLKSIAEKELNYLLKITFKKTEGTGFLGAKAKLASSSLATFFDKWGAANELVGEETKKYKVFLEKEHLVNMQMSASLAIFSENETELMNFKQRIQKLQFWPSAQFIDNIYTPVREWFGCFPGLDTYHPFNVNISNLHAAYLTPFLTFINSNSDRLVFPVLDRNSNLVNFNPLSEKNQLHSCITVAPSRKGKSVFLNNIIIFYMNNFHGKMASLIMDYGGSYKNLVMYLNKFLNFEDQINYIELRLTNVSYNIFDIPYGVELHKSMAEEKLSLLITFLAIALEHGLSEKEKGLLRLAINRLYETYLFDNSGSDFKKNKTSGKTYVDIYKESSYSDQAAYKAMMPNLNDLAKTLFTDSVVRGQFDEEVRLELRNKISAFLMSFEGDLFKNNSTDILNYKNVVYDFLNVFVLKNLHLNRLFLIYLMQSFLMVHRKESYKKLMVIDEYFQFSEADNYVNDTMRNFLMTGAKDNITLYCASQSINHFPKDAFNSVGYIVMFEPNSENEINDIKNMLGLSDYEVLLLKSLKTKVGLYSEMLILSYAMRGKEKIVVRNKLTPFEYWLTSTSPGERALKAIYLKRYGDIALAILSIIKDTQTNTIEELITANGIVIKKEDVIEDKERENIIEDTKEDIKENIVIDTKEDTKE